MRLSALYAAKESDSGGDISKGHVHSSICEYTCRAFSMCVASAGVYFSAMTKCEPIVPVLPRSTVICDTQTNTGGVFGTPRTLGRKNQHTVVSDKSRHIAKKNISSNFSITIDTLFFYFFMTAL